MKERDANLTEEQQEMQQSLESEESKQTGILTNAAEKI